MKKYILISLVLHLIILFGFGVMQTAQLGKDEPKNQVVPIAFVAKQTSENPGGKVLDTEEREKQSPEPPKPKVEKKPEEKKPEEKKPEKKEIESNIPSKDAKPVEKQPETTTSENTQSTESADKVESTPSDNNSSSRGGNTSSTGSGDEGFGSNFISDGDGSYIALSSKGINYQIINEVEPDYPSQAESIGYSKQVKVTVKFLVGLKGNVEKAEITQSHKDLGFDAEVMKAIKKWKFKPIYHNGKNIKVYFVKTFVFDPQ
ncbi:energy transducer TonB [Fusobacterium nucleatum]|uniref:energy transducer TonB n=1 Tax=Fusobacterium nucleatum TaxID=851 RepID=UPI0030D4DA6F